MIPASFLNDHAYSKPILRNTILPTDYNGSSSTSGSCNIAGLKDNQSKPI